MEMSNPMAPRLQLKYQQEIAPELAKRLEISNVMAVPRLEKVIINMGVGSAMQDKKNLDIAADALTEIAGQRPVLTKSRASIAGFRLREGVPIGAKVTLRRAKMYEFLDRLISIVLPRVRDFRGVSRTAFDGNGNYSLGLSEQLVFPELNPDKFTKPQGMNITVVTTANTNEEAFQLLELLGMPFRAPRKPKGS
jgi:large subunit ribosomal protein L5